MKRLLIRESAVSDRAFEEAFNLLCDMSKRLKKADWWNA